NVDIKTALHWSRLPWVMVLPLVMEIVEGWALNEFAKLKQTLPIANGTNVEFHVLHGDPVNEVVKLSETVSAKLIVLVAHKHSLRDRLINGSHADKLLHASRTPIIVLCEPVKSDSSLPQDILITTDFSPESLPVFLVLADLIQGVKSNITVLTVETAFQHHPKASAMLADLEKEFLYLGLQLRNVKVKASAAEAGILDYVKTHKPQLIAMSSHGRLGLAELFHANVTKAILHEVGVPVLVVHGKAMPTTEEVANLADLLTKFTGLNHGGGRAA
ncbi:MAG: universal stress protein, partial [Candidatus Methylumidiphilus sp.]